MSKKTYQVQLSYATFGIIVRGNVVINAAPIGRWLIGKSFDEAKDWVRSKGGKVKYVCT